MPVLSTDQDKPAATHTWRSLDDNSVALLRKTAQGGAAIGDGG